LNVIREGDDMESTNALVRIADQPALDRVARPVSDAIRGAYSRAGEAGHIAKNTLHGVWLGHPLHPVFTDVPLGAWTAGLVLDAVAAKRRDRGMARAADVAMAVGLAGAAASAVTGLTDWSEVDGHSRRIGLVHGLLNIAATTLYAVGLALRKKGARSAGTSCAIAGYTIAIGSAFLGGDLVYDQRIGVTHADAPMPERFTAVADAAALHDNSMMHAKTDEADVLLARQRGRVCALAHSCSHLGGPLSDGTLKDGSVVCPWHGSEFALEDGHVINGPATVNQPCLDVREQTGKIEVRARG
jgi:nitrite reductase/ring-hydroxylating ferredoxin subunit